MRLLDRFISLFLPHAVLWRKKSMGIITVEKNFEEGKLVIKRDNKTLSGIFVGTSEPTSQLYWFPHLVDLFPRLPCRILCLGGGACVYPSYAVRKNRDITIDVVEVDPVVIEAARKFFAVPSTSRLSLVQGDGLAFLLQAKRSMYDFIFVDVGITMTYTQRVYNAQFLNTAALDGYRFALEHHGTLMLNIMTTLSPRDVQKVSQQLRLFTKHFPVHLVFKVTRGTDAAKLQDVIHVFSRQRVTIAKMKQMLKAREGGSLAYPKDRYSYVLNANM